jgi:hypothetical protein
MVSDDQTLTLTTHRLIHRTATTTNQIMLEDFVDYRYTTRHIGNYKFLTIIFSILSFYLLYRFIREYTFEKQAGIRDDHLIHYIFNSGGLFLLLIPVLLLIVSFVFYKISRRYYITVNGKYGSIQFRIRHPRPRSIERFLQAISLASKNLKSAL